MDICCAVHARACVLYSVSSYPSVSRSYTLSNLCVFHVILLPPPLIPFINITHSPIIFLWIFILFLNASYLSNHISFNLNKWCELFISSHIMTLHYCYLHISIHIFTHHSFWPSPLFHDSLIRKWSWILLPSPYIHPHLSVSSVPAVPPRPAAVWTAPTVVPLARREARKLTHPVHPVATAAWHIRLQEVPTASAVSPPTTRASSLRMPTSTPNPPHPCPRISPARYHSLTVTHLLLLSTLIKKRITVNFQSCLGIYKVFVVTVSKKKKKSYLTKKPYSFEHKHV